ncbi:MAG: response regulator [Myxococcales bacterium]
MAFGQVLIVDDEADFAQLIAEELERAGFGARVATNGAEGLEVLRSAEKLPALILLDLKMPVMDGYHFREEQRKHERWRDIPVVAMSAVSSRGRPSAEALDVQGWLAKPFDLNALLELLRTAPIRP